MDGQKTAMNAKMIDNLPSNLTPNKLQIPPIFIDFLKKRGVEGDEALERFLFPRLADLPMPGKMQNLVEAAHLVVEYMTAGKQIVIWGDYDVDGTTGTALLVNFFRECGVEVSWHIPNRLLEGYGLNIDWFQRHRGSLLSDDFLLITVDCGISNGSEIARIKEMGGTVIVTDHHNLPEYNLPICLILNPSTPTCGFHREQLAGVGVAFYLVAGIRAELTNKKKFKAIAENINLKQYLAFVALGTIADVVDLTTTNRILVRAGMEALVCSNFAGLQEILSSCDIAGGVILSEDIGYVIGPKINAAGRLGQSDLVVTLLTESDRKKAKRLAGILTAFNNERKRICADNLEKTLSKISASRVDQDKCVIARGLLHQGVVGIVASKLVEVYGVPALVFAEKESPDKSLSYVGSARSIEGISILEMLKACSEWIERFGGHEMAAGLTVTAANFADFSSRFSAIAKEKWQWHRIRKKIRYDIECSVENIMSDAYLDFMKLLEPFGPGNLQPIFQDNQARIVDSRVVGKTSEHLQLTIRGKYANHKGIGFSLGNKINDVQKDSERTMVYTPTINRFRGNVSWQVRVIDV
ncbi:MAG: single-stranded-DNA-specific exonuclease RecJ [Proteobacteria bacterium]|nr:single-stranded-DNA-specific exonuclease RecJ [Pseudomonadota bacterium]